MLRALSLAGALLLTSGCVMKSKYVELETEYANTRSQLESDVADRNGTILKLEGEVEALSAQVDKLKSDLEATEQSAATLRKQNENMLKSKEGLEGEIVQMQAALEELERRKAKSEARLQEFRALVSAFQKMIDAGTLSVKIVNGRMVVVLATDVLFGSGSATLSREGKDALAEVAQILAGIEKREFQVEGHTDNIPISSDRFPNNWYLASARAINVVDHLVNSGMPADRISAASYGEFRPVDTNKTKEGRAQNRRIEIVVVPDLSQLPGYNELQEL